MCAGGSSDNGPTAKKFFSQKWRKHILKLFQNTTRAGKVKSLYYVLCTNAGREKLLSICAVLVCMYLPELVSTGMFLFQY